MPRPLLRVSVDARPLDIRYMRAQGIGRYAHGLVGPLAQVASERHGELVLLRKGAAEPGAFAGELPAGVTSHRLRRPPVPTRFADWPEHVLLPVDLRRLRVAVHHSLSIYRSALRTGVPSVMTMHDVVPLMWPELYLRTGWMHRTLYRAARNARLILAVSEAARRDVIHHLGLSPERVLCVPEAADERFRPADPRPARERFALEGPYVLFVGGLATRDPRKNVEGLIDAYADWRRAEGRPELLVLSGQLGPAAEQLRERADRTGAPVVFTGFVDDAQLPSLISGASCFVTATRYEGFGLPALEAVSCGTPVVAFDAGAVPEVAGPGCLAVTDGDTAALMRAVSRVCDEPELRQALSERGRRHAGRYSWRRTAELTWDAYERVARSAAAPAYAGGSNP